RVEQRLAALRERLAFPSVDVAPAVAARVAEEPAPRRAPVIPLPRSRSMRRAVVVAVAAVLLLAAAAVAGRLGVPGLRVIFEPGPAPTNLPIGSNLSLGRHVRLDEARRAVTFEILTPHGQGLGRVAVYVGPEPPGGRVSLVYPAGPGLPASRFTRAGLLITEFRAQIDDTFVKKLTFTGARVTNVDVNGAPGLWFSGAPHELFYVDVNGAEYEQSERLAGNALVWSLGGVTIRLECRCSLSMALRI